MAERASTDDIVKVAYETSKTYWKEFIAFPIAVTFALFVLMALLVWAALAFNPRLLGLINLVYLLLLVFWTVYFSAQVKWCEEIHKGAKSIDIKSGLQFGLSRFWGVLGTNLLTGLKVMLWMLLFILPGYYKGLMYSKSLYVSTLEGISGGDANRISEAIIKKAGPIRTLSNMMGVMTLTYLAMIIAGFAIFLVAGLFGIINEYAGIMIGAVAGGIAFTFIMSVLTVYLHFEYLYFRDEAKAEVTKLKKAFS